MAKKTKKSLESKSVRIYANTKYRLQTVARKKAAIEDREVTEIELADSYVLVGVAKDERKLGIV